MSETANEFPAIMYIVSYQFEPERFKPKVQSDPVEEGILNRLSDNCKVISKEHPLTISVNSHICKIRKIDDEDSRTYVVSVFSDKRDLENENAFLGLNELSPQIRRLLDAFPKNPISEFTAMTRHSRGLDESFAELEKYFHLSNKPVTSAGIAKNHLLAILKEDIENAEGYLRRSMLLSSLEDSADKAAAELNNFVEDIAHYASLTGRLHRLFRERAVIFKQIESSEKNTQERIQDMLGNIRRPPDQVKPVDLGSMLTEVSGIFSRLTTITSSMRRDHILARSYLRGIRGIFNSWDEKPVINYPTNSSVEISRFEGMVDSFGDNVDRLEALRIQLDTLLDMIRTHVGIQQQNVSVDEQRDTKKLLARMVNLQEVLHKLEIFVVAFYITEMARLVFETIAHDIVNILTVVFIPVALLLAIGIRKLLHRQE